MIYQVVIYFLIEGEHDSFQLEGLMESPSVDDDVDCFSPLQLNATSINIEVYYSKAVNYTLMVTFVSFSHQYSFNFKTIIVHYCMSSLTYIPGLVLASSSVDSANGA